MNRNKAGKEKERMFSGGAIFLVRGVRHGPSRRRDKVKMAEVQRASSWRRIEGEAG